MQRNERQDLIREIVRNQQIRTQRELVEALAQRGLECTQATVSRDVAEIGLQKRSDGFYILSEDVHMRRMVGDLVQSVEVANNIVVVKALQGTAQGVAAALDAASIPMVLGTVAGDDTILIVAKDEPGARQFQQTLERLKS